MREIWTMTKRYVRQWEVIEDGRPGRAGSDEPPQATIVGRVPEGRDIPRPLRRQALIEAGHRCAIPTCRQYPVEVDHIDDYANVKEHRFENLIVLCRNCHGRKTAGPDRVSCSARWFFGVRIRVDGDAQGLPSSRSQSRIRLSRAVGPPWGTCYRKYVENPRRSQGCASRVSRVLNPSRIPG
jgi:hypothetical protein